MGWNPCCCWKLKDATITIGIWAAVYSVAQVALFGWQWGVLSQCEHVTMAQSNLQCEYWCPCVGASTARTSAILFAVVELGIYGWQMAAIKYERDRAANTLLPNYNTYGRYDIPSYYESYWQSPEERYYTGLFVIQVLCLIANFFLLFASVALIYGVHAWSRFLVWPWIPVMIASILTSTAYCVMWWAGDVRDYWLVLTILEIFGVFINVYLTLVVCVFYSRMNRVLEHYEGKRQTKNYNRFSPNVTSQELDVTEAIDEGEMGYRNQWDDPDRWYPDPKYPPPPPDPYFDSKLQYPPYGAPLKRPLDDPAFEPVTPATAAQLSHAQSVPSLFDDSFRDVPRGHHHHRRSHRHKSSACQHCHSRRRRRHSHGRSRSRCKHDCSDAGSSLGLSESTDSRCHHHHGHSHRHHRREYSDDESDTTCKHRHRSEKRGPRQVKRDDREQKELKHCSTQADPDFGSPTQGFTIPQNIVIPPVDAGLDADGNVIPRKYQINSEITISYDPQQQALGISPRPETRNSGLRSNPRTPIGAPVSFTSNV